MEHERGAEEEHHGMTTFLAKLNLRPAELRLVVLVAAVVLALLYMLFIWPQFGEWQKLQKRKETLQTDLARYQKEIDRTSLYQRELAALQSKGGRVDPDAQGLDLQRIITSQALAHNVVINGYTAGKGSPGGLGRTNAFFEEQSGTINFLADESALVSFLYALSSGDSLIRVADMTLNPDTSRMKLQGNIKFVASYHKKAASKPAAPTAVPAAPAAAKAAAPNPAAPKSISAAASAAAQPGAVRSTNAGPASLWGKIKGWFASKTNVTAKPAAPATNVPPKK
jgi:hypothetical protein